MPNSVASHSSYASSSASKASTVTKLQKLVLKKRFYERVDDFHNKVVLHSEPGLIVYRARCGYSGAVVVLKGYFRDTLTLQVKERVWNEVQMLQNASCPFMLKCFDAFEDQGSWWLVLENSACGDLYNVCQSNGGSVKDEAWVVRQLMVPLLQTLAYLHRDGIIHRDIRGENILFNSEKVAKLTGFFWSVDTSRTGYPRDLVGTLDYMAPEIYLINNHQEAAKDPEILKAYPELLSKSRNQYDHKVDVWQLGCLTYEVMMGRAPFSSESSCPDETVRNLLLISPDFPSWLSDDAVDFISQALHKDADQRPSARDLLGHPWIQSQLDSDDDYDYSDPIPPVDYSYYDDDEAEIGDRESDEGDNEEWRVKRVWYDPRTWVSQPQAQPQAQAGEWRRGGGPASPHQNESRGFLEALTSWMGGGAGRVAPTETDPDPDRLVKGLNLQLQSIEVKSSLMPQKEGVGVKVVSSPLDNSSGDSNESDSFGSAHASAPGPHSPRVVPKAKNASLSKKAGEGFAIDVESQQRTMEPIIVDRSESTDIGDIFNQKEGVHAPFVPKPDPNYQPFTMSTMTPLPLPSVSMPRSGSMSQKEKKIDISFSPSPAPPPY